MSDSFFKKYGDDLPEVDEPERKVYTLDEAIKALPQPDGLFPLAVIMGLSSLTPKQLEQVRPVWEKLPDEQRIRIMKRLAEASLVDFEVDYNVFALSGYTDKNEEVRAASIEANWADDLMREFRRLMKLAQQDSAVIVRAAAIAQLGNFIYRGEVDELNHKTTRQAEDLALKLYNNQAEDIRVRCRALESVARCTRPDNQKNIQAAYQHERLEMRISAVRAMGNTCDRHWKKEIQNELESPVENMLIEAIRSAGALGMKESIRRIGKLSREGSFAVQSVAITALGEIGGKNAIQELHRLEKVLKKSLRDGDYDEDDIDDLLEAIEEAIDLASLMGGSSMLDMFEFEPEDPDDLLADNE